MKKFQLLILCIPRDYNDQSLLFFFFHCFLDYVLLHLEVREKSILWYFSSKFGLEFPRICIHTYLKFGVLLRKYVGELIVKT